MANTDSPEALLDAFKAAALSVTKLYKTSAIAQSKARADGYQDCLDDLLVFLDKGHLGLTNYTEAKKIRQWVTERLENRDTPPTTADSEDEVDKVETASSPELHRAGSVGLGQPSALQEDTSMRTDSAPPAVHPAIAEQRQASPQQQKQEQEASDIAVPTLDNFNFSAQIPYPQDTHLSIENLDLSDNRQGRRSPSHVRATAPLTITRTSRRHGGVNRSGNRASNMLGMGAGQKRKLDLSKIFNLESLEYNKDVFGSRNGKRNRHT